VVTYCHRASESRSSGLWGRRSSATQDKCLTDWFVKHLSTSQLSGAVGVKSVADIAKHPAIFGEMVEANQACANALGERSNE
jgi:hypothetical protein